MAPYSHLTGSIPSTQRADLSALHVSAEPMRGTMRRLVTTLTLLASALVAACGGLAITPVPSAAPSAVATSAPSAQGGPIDTLPTLPAGWARYESPGAFTIGVPATWLVMTSTERNDSAAETALKAKYPTYSAKIDTALVQMRDQDLLVLAGDVNGDATVSAASMFIKKVPGTLDLAFATSAAAAAQKQLKIGVPLTVQAMTKPAGSYCYDFAVDMAPTSMAGRQCLFPSGYYDVYVMTFLTTVAQIATYSPTVLSLPDTFVAAAAPGAAPSATPAPPAITPPSPVT